MSEWIEMKGNSIEDTNSKGYVENILRSYQAYLDETLTRGVGNVKQQEKKQRKTKRIVWDQKVYEAVWEEKVAHRAWKTNIKDEKLRQQWKDKKKARKTMVRKHQKITNRKKIADIEQLKSKDPKEYWKQLKKLSDIEEKKNLPQKIKSETNEWIIDKAGVEEVWARAFEKLGTEGKTEGNLMKDLQKKSERE